MQSEYLHILGHVLNQLTSTRTTAEAQDFIKEFLNAVPKSRNAQLAQLDLIHWGVQSGSLSKDDLYSASQEYFDRNKSKLYCFGDLQKYLPELEKHELSKFVEYTLKTQEGESDVRQTISSSHFTSHADPE